MEEIYVTLSRLKDGRGQRRGATYEGPTADSKHAPIEDLDAIRQVLSVSTHLNRSFLMGFLSMGR